MLREVVRGYRQADEQYRQDMLHAMGQLCCALTREGSDEWRRIDDGWAWTGVVDGEANDLAARLIQHCQVSLDPVDILAF